MGQVTDCRLPLRAGLRVQKREAWASPGAPVMAPGTAWSHCTRITAPGSLPSLASFPHSNVILMLHPTVSISRVKQMERENKPSGAATPPALSASTVHQKNGSFRQTLRLGGAEARPAGRTHRTGGSGGQVGLVARLSPGPRLSRPPGTCALQAECRGPHLLTWTAHQLARCDSSSAHQAWSWAPP